MVGSLRFCGEELFQECRLCLRQQLAAAEAPANKVMLKLWFTVNEDALELDEFLHAGDALETSEELTDAEVIAKVLAADNSDGDDTSDDMVEQIGPTLSSQEILWMLQSLWGFVLARALPLHLDVLEKHVGKVCRKHTKLMDMGFSCSIKCEVYVGDHASILSCPVAQGRTLL